MNNKVDHHSLTTKHILHVRMTEHNTLLFVARDLAVYIFFSFAFELLTIIISNRERANHNSNKKKLRRLFPNRAILCFRCFTYVVINLIRYIQQKMYATYVLLFLTTCSLPHLKVHGHITCGDEVTSV